MAVRSSSVKNPGQNQRPDIGYPESLREGLLAPASTFGSCRPATAPFVRQDGDMTPFDAASTTEDVLEGIDLMGRTILITGTSAGLGVEATHAPGTCS